jgi:hypothetical protein
MPFSSMFDYKVAVIGWMQRLGGRKRGYPNKIEINSDSNSF